MDREELRRAFAHIERGAKAVLRDVGWPVDVNDPFYRASRTSRRRRSRIAQRDKQRGLWAFMCLTELEEARAAVDRGDLHAAAFFALEAGLHAFDGPYYFGLAQQTRKGGRTTGQRASSAAEAAQHDTLRLWQRYRRTAETPDFGQAVAYIAAHRGEHPKTIRRRLKKAGIAA